MGPRVPRSGCNLWAVFPSRLCPRRTVKGGLAMPEEGWAPAPMSAQMQCLPGCVGGWGPEHRLWACGNGDPTGATGRQGGSPPWSFPPPLTGSDGGGMAASAALALPVLSVWSQVCACVCLRSHDGHVCACVCACAGGGAAFPAQTASSLGPLGIRLLAPSPHLCLGPFRLRGAPAPSGTPQPPPGKAPGPLPTFLRRPAFSKFPQRPVAWGREKASCLPGTGCWLLGAAGLGEGRVLVGPEGWRPGSGSHRVLVWSLSHLGPDSLLVGPGAVLAPLWASGRRQGDTWPPATGSRALCLSHCFFPFNN
ncbi:PREDICTED: uncharacterized protein LOC109380124 [Hipposideros armiger]|uniref:Uncharacterized protein LOC109380124 n=1 Tax=Hipposideros armiger TaxID=186990 RepID=A0A8B7QXA6_HIPAR|nr:PREDICTED: uncharacterized protein LOC109380124 [Hipposideros armiger]XP_019492938.1 PREDICTED: uncharacterized protein LOC109380124 [Hipposideros armiger]